MNERLLVALVETIEREAGDSDPAELLRTLVVLLESTAGGLAEGITLATGRPTTARELLAAAYAAGDN